jgi:DNA-binding transcriptional MerR regulator
VPDEEPDLITSSQLVKKLGLSRRTISLYAQRGLITPAVRTPGGQYRWVLEDVKAEMRAMWQREQQAR